MIAAISWVSLGDVSVAGVRGDVADFFVIFADFGFFGFFGSRPFTKSANFQVDFSQIVFISLRSWVGSDSISSTSLSNSSCAAIESSRARCLSMCSRFRISERISRLYDGSPGRKILAISAVS